MSPTCTPGLTATTLPDNFSESPHNQGGCLKFPEKTANVGILEAYLSFDTTFWVAITDHYRASYREQNSDSTPRASPCTTNPHSPPFPRGTSTRIRPEDGRTDVVAEVLRIMQATRRRARFIACERPTTCGESRALVQVAARRDTPSLALHTRVFASRGAAPTSRAATSSLARKHLVRLAAARTQAMCFCVHVSSRRPSFPLLERVHACMYILLRHLIARRRRLVVVLPPLPFISFPPFFFRLFLHNPLHAQGYLTRGYFL